MKRFFVAMLATFMFTMSLGAVQTSAEEEASKENVQLSEQQKQELATLHKEVLEKRKEVISKYVEFGLISEEKGKKILSHLDEQYKKLEENGYIPHWGHGKHKHHKHHKE